MGLNHAQALEILAQVTVIETDSDELAPDFRGAGKPWSSHFTNITTAVAAIKAIAETSVVELSASPSKSPSISPTPSTSPSLSPSKSPSKSPSISPTPSTSPSVSPSPSV